MYNEGKYLSGIHLVSALEHLAVAYYQHSSPKTLAALQATREEVERRLNEWSSSSHSEKEVTEETSDVPF